MKHSPYQTPALGAILDTQRKQYEETRIWMNQLDASGAPKSVVNPLLTSLGQQRNIIKNMERSYKKLLALEKANQATLQAAAPKLTLDEALAQAK